MRFQPANSQIAAPRKVRSQVPIIVGTHHEISSVGRGVSVAAVWLLLSTDRIAARTLGLSKR
jgi:hypothetical protein